VANVCDGSEANLSANGSPEIPDIKPAVTEQGKNSPELILFGTPYSFRRRNAPTCL